LSRPRKSAVAIVLTRDADGLLRVLIGRRNPKLRLLGGYYAFPGGAIEETDGSLDTEAEEDVLRRTASRELEEETGVIVPPDAFQPAGRRITPPFVPVRFDSLMFVAEVDSARAIEPEVPGELLDIRWASPQALRDEWRDLSIRVAPPLIPILQQLAEAEAETLAEIAARLRATNAFMEDDGPRIEFVPDVLMMPIETPTLPPATTTNS
jgi:8-oxo-dGTP pyrophosphatase MutT (NUDIX family)